MKFVTNHNWKFVGYRVAFLSGLMQVTVMVLIAICNYAVITISPNIMELAKDFTALSVISYFDRFLGNLRGFQDITLEILTKHQYRNLFKIETTTSLEVRLYDTNNVFLAPDRVFE